MKIIPVLLSLCAFVAVKADLREDWQSVFCGEGVSCYEVLGLNSSCTQEDITKAYRALALTLHPDRVKTAEKEAAEEKFKDVVTANDILSDPEKRKIYDDVTALKNRMWVPKEDPIVVLLFCVALLVGIVHYYQLAAHSQKRKLLLCHNAVQRKIRQKFKAEGKVVRTKNNQIEEEIPDEMLTEVVNELGLRVSGGWTGEKPKIQDLLKRAPFVPVTAAKWVAWSLKWVIKYTILGKEYEDSDKIYLTRQKLELSEFDWEQLTDKQQKRYMDEELWRGAKSKKQKKPKAKSG